MAKAKPKKHTAAEIAAKAKAATQVRAAGRRRQTGIACGPARVCASMSKVANAYFSASATAAPDQQPLHPPPPPQNAGGGKAGLADRKGGAVGHAKFK